MFKIGAAILTIAISSFFIWYGHFSQFACLAALIVFLSGLLFLFFYELYLRLLKKSDLIKQDILKAMRKDLENIKQDLSEKNRPVYKELENIQLAQVHNLHLTDRMVEVFKKLVDQIENPPK